MTTEQWRKKTEGMNELGKAMFEKGKFDLVITDFAMPAMKGDELAKAIFEWIECWYNPTRRHSSIGMLSPVDFEQLHTPSDHSR